MNKTKDSSGSMPAPKQPRLATPAVVASEVIEPFSPDPVTTLMIRNLANNVTQLQIINEIKKFGYDGTIDFLYMSKIQFTSSTQRSLPMRSMGSCYVPHMCSLRCDRFGHLVA